MQERCSVVSRLAPTFLRFGSFEIFKARDTTTGTFDKVVYSILPASLKRIS